MSSITRNILTASRRGSTADQTISKAFGKVMSTSSEVASSTTATKLPAPTVEQLRIVAYRAAIPVSFTFLGESRSCFELDDILIETHFFCEKLDGGFWVHG